MRDFLLVTISTNYFFENFWGSISPDIIWVGQSFAKCAQLQTMTIKVSFMFYNKTTNGMKGGLFLYWCNLVFLSDYYKLDLIEENILLLSEIEEDIFKAFKMLFIDLYSIPQATFLKICFAIHTGPNWLKNGTIKKCFLKK